MKDWSLALGRPRRGRMARIGSATSDAVAYDWMMPDPRLIRYRKAHVRGSVRQSHLAEITGSTMAAERN